MFLHLSPLSHLQGGSPCRHSPPGDSELARIKTVENFPREPSSIADRGEKLAQDTGDDSAVSRSELWSQEEPAGICCPNRS